MDLISREKAIVQLSHNKSGNDDSDVVIQHDIETVKGLSSAFEGMTNGEVFQSIFPCDEVIINGIQEGIVHFSMKSNPDSMDCFDLEWWNAPYKAESEVKPNDIRR